MRYSESTFPIADGEGEKNSAAGSFSALPAMVLILFIKFYRLIFSPAQVFLFGAGSGCRFTPTCSQYAAEAIRRHGARAGAVLAAKRICRCHPLGECGHDPVPTERGASLISNG
ncbi:MAG TPA: membrane protein insertion efficiency factor YidD [Verrucomicrobiae bacterium]|jgi:hypothetical protein|nr:membrane protein insertion efficiency factor YidD [Verrucomicrobiae bacterium]